MSWPPAKALRVRLFGLVAIVIAINARRRRPGVLLPPVIFLRRCRRMVKIAVTGASGFLGRHVVAALSKADAEIVAHARRGKAWARCLDAAVGVLRPCGRA